jgi:uncharacterized protein (TIGR00369 family)
MNTSVRTGLVWDMIEGRRPLPAVSKLLGWKLVSIDPAKGTIKVEFAAVSSFTNPIGTIQGGIIAAMLDDAMGPAATVFVGGHHMAPTVELKVNFMRPAAVGRLFVDARVVHRGRDIVFLEGAMTGEDGRLLATATATARLLYDWPNRSRDGGS